MVGTVPDIALARGNGFFLFLTVAGSGCCAFFGEGGGGREVYIASGLGTFDMEFGI